ncbi:Ketoacyl-synt-domain-containing protein [Mycena venus]|uniref:Ketoacyl-synt-domain-containing protein n=1 Tax=Mycena venus TaxID=2733690 RepID=A0A8H7D3C3_9AGAR|nr:Ketoacyl-synt-domain-containing protein [Mycena venus]
MEVPVDRSHVLFVCTANNLNTILAPLLDRMEVLEISGVHFGGKGADHVTVPGAAGEGRVWAQGDQVRILKKHIEKIFRKAALKLVQDLSKDVSPEPETEAVTEGAAHPDAASTERKPVTTQERKPLPIPESVHVRIVPENSKDYVGSPVYQKDRMYPHAPPPSSMHRKGGLQLTGKLSEVICESPHISLSWVKSNADELGITTPPRSIVLEIQVLWCSFSPVRVPSISKWAGNYSAPFPFFTAAFSTWMLPFSRIFGCTSPHSAFSSVWPIAVTLPAIAMFQMALFDLLVHFGVSPDTVVGHSAGETAVLYALIAASKSMALKLFHISGDISGDDGGAFLYLYRHGTTAQHSRGIVELACLNSPSAVAITGYEVSIDGVLHLAEQNGILARKFRARVPIHSPMMDVCRDQYLVALRGLFDRYEGLYLSKIPTYSTLTGDLFRGPFDPEYFSRFYLLRKYRISTGHLLSLELRQILS